MGEQREKQLARDLGRLEAERDRERRRADAAEELVVVLQAEKQALQAAVREQGLRLDRLDRIWQEREQEKRERSTFAAGWVPAGPAKDAVIPMQPGGEP